MINYTLFAVYSKFYTDTLPTGFKSGLKFSRVPRSIRFGCDADRMNQRYEGSLWAFPGACTPQNRTYRAWGRDGYCLLN